MGDSQSVESFEVDAFQSLKKVDKIKARVNTGLASADGSKNTRIIKQELDLMKNPIISAIKKTLRLSSKKNKKLPKEYHIAMMPAKIYELMDTVMQEKVWVDLESEQGPLESRSPWWRLSPARCQRESLSDGAPVSGLRRHELQKQDPAGPASGRSGHAPQPRVERSGRFPRRTDGV